MRAIGFTAVSIEGGELGPALVLRPLGDNAFDATLDAKITQGITTQSLSQFKFPALDVETER